MAICERCGGWTEPPVLERGEEGIESVCPECGRRAPFTQHPLWWITGSPGSGKTTLVPLLRQLLSEYVVFEGEAIDFWRFEGEPGDYSSLHNQWLKVAHELAVNDLRVVMVATALPAQLDACTMRNRFSEIHCLGLVCDAEIQMERLRARPAWRKTDTPEMLAQAVGFTRVLRDRAAEGRLDVIDTGAATPEETAWSIAAWVRARGDGSARLQDNP